MARILFVDDDIFTLETYQKMVALFGHEAVLAESGVCALQVLGDTGVDLIILDRRLPDMDGFALLKRLKEMEDIRAVPVVMVSASHDSFSQRAVAEGAQEYICKPLLTQDIKALIDRYTAG